MTRSSKWGSLANHVCSFTLKAFMKCTLNVKEFHLSQTYHEGLLKLQAKEYAKARELLEAVLKDPLISSAQVESSASDGHLLQLRFLALKNLANIFLQQGSMHYESALNCYLQAVEIDSKDSVVWNQLGTLSCSMGLLSISRWAFEQGLHCSPNNWNCMEKLLEVLVAIRDETACLSIAELILRYWPSHSRALHVKNTIEELDSVPFSPRGIDKLEPKHVRLTFSEKRKRIDSNAKEGSASKRVGKNMELHLAEASWEALADAILGILLPIKRSSELWTKSSKQDLVNGNIGLDRASVTDTDSQEAGVQVLHTSEEICHSENLDKCKDIRLNIHLPLNSEIRTSSESKRQIVIPTCETVSTNECGMETNRTVKEKEGLSCEEHPQERRSTRLERLRSRKPGKEELDFATSKDLAKVVVRVLEPFVLSKPGTKEFNQAVNDAAAPNFLAHLSDTEHDEVTRFVSGASKNYGAYHLGHLLLEDVARRKLPYQDGFVKFLELEKLTRNWGQDRTIDCCLFLAELYYDYGLCSADESKKSVSLSEASYQLCKVIETVSLDSPVDWNSVFRFNTDSRMTTYMSQLKTNRGKSECTSGNEILLLTNSSQEIAGRTIADDSVSHELILDNSILTNKSSFWVRFFWLGGCLSILASDKVKAYEELCISLALLRKNKTADGLPGSVLRPHCKFARKLSVERVLHEIHLLKVGLLLEKTLNEMIDKQMYLDCVYLLAPLLLSTEEVYLNFSPGGCVGGEGVVPSELSALDILIKACEKAKPMDIEVYLKCHRRKLQMLLVAAGMAEQKACIPKPGSAFEMKTVESISPHWTNLVAEEVKAISRCASQVKNFIDQLENPDGFSVPVSIIGGIQALLLTYMRNIISIFLCKKSSDLGTADQTQQMESCSFVEAVIAFCKVQQLNQSVPVKTQVDLIVAVHDLLAEYGLCCSGKDSEGEEGTFLKLAIKHLLFLDMKIKSSTYSAIKGFEPTPSDEISVCDLNSSGISKGENNLVEKDETLSVKYVSSKSMSEGLPDHGLKDRKHSSDSEFHQIQELKTNNPAVVDQLVDTEELGIDNALDQCFFCLYGLNLRSSDSSSEEDLATHKNTSRGDYQTKEQCADVFQYILPYVKASSRTGLVKVRRVLRAIRKHFRQPPENMMKENSVDNFLDNPDLCEDKICEEGGSDITLEYVMSIIFPNGRSSKLCTASAMESSEPYLEVYGNLYYFLAQAEETSATDKWPGFVLTKEGEEFVEQNANLLKYDLLFNPLRFESWQQLATIYDEEVDLLLNDGSKHINVVGWRRNPSLPQRVEVSRRRSRRCLLVSLALAKTPAQQSEIHELLALVYYDGIQNVVPIYDQRSVVPTKDAMWTMFCQNSMKHFEKAFTNKPEWSHAFYLGKLCEKLGYPYEKSFSYYEKAINLNPSAVDPVYRMHASRLKLLSTCGKQNVEALKVVASHCFDQSTNATIVNQSGSVLSQLPMDVEEKSNGTDSKESKKEGDHLEEAWNILYSDCLSALEVCVEGELKHFHKARYMLAQGWYRKGVSGSLERAKDELSFCFKSSRSSFTINMWEIDSTVKKGRRKTPGLAGNKKALEVSLAESSRKFITCIRKYTLFYLKLLLESGDTCTLDRAYVSLRADKRFSLCLEDLVPVALGRLIQALMSSICQAETLGKNFPQHLLERMFQLFIDQGNLWTDISSLAEVKSPELSEGSFYGYLHQYIHSLERDLRLDTLEGINEKIRKRFKNPKLSNNNCSKVCRHASVAWCRSILISLATITSLNSKDTNVIQVSNPAGDRLENTPLLCVALQDNEVWNLSFEDPAHQKVLETKWSTLLSKINGIVIMQASDESMELANTLLRSAYNFYRESSCGSLLSGINLYTVPSLLAIESSSQIGMDGADIIDLSVPRKLLLWAYTLVHGRYINILAVVKHCEENAKSKIKKGTIMSSSASSHTNAPALTATQIGGGKEKVSHIECGEAEISPATVALSVSVPESEGICNSHVLSCSSETQKSEYNAPQLHQCNNVTTEKSSSDMQEGEE
ncbi:Calcineurin-binding protein [Thalictrum thalictroides]|uniref:Calcineurin-binding protein n=1 Tax=Thalictrum thalictroides TaxID=46969 RepID=A0A7J6W5F8_THATH|nr:Calcineurin-binding protein [Thalictrum thalictroides]